MSSPGTHRRVAPVAATVAVVVLALAALLMPAVPVRAQQPAEWEDAAFDPARADDDLLLPMPCGGRMAFRYIATEASTDLLADEQVILGQVNDETNYSEYIRRENIVGSLSVSPLGQRRTFFYLGKYEVTQDQYDAVMNQTCPEPSVRGRIPVTNLSWFDAVAFSRAYTEWLLQNQPASLPMEGERHAFLRLPTEVEWEFAMRGGAAVDDQQFRQRLPPMTDDIARYAWFQGPRSADGVMHPIGLLSGNPLGLHDMLGNAEEFVLDPYQLNRAGRRHGQVGGFVTRGGSFRTPGDRLRSSMRIEYSYFDDTTSRATRLDTFGFRLVISAPIEVSLERIQQLRADWSRIAQGPEEPGSFNPMTALDTLAQGTTDIETRQTLEQIAAAFRSELTVRSEVEARSLRRAITSGAVLIRALRLDNGVIRSIQTAYDYENQRDPNSTRSQQLRGQLDGLHERFDNTLRAYFDILVQASDDYPAARHREQLAIQLQEFQQSGLEALSPFAERFTQQCLDYQRTHDLNRNTYLQQILQ